MSDEPISNRPADMTSTDTDTEEVANEDKGPQIFDITPDLNIAPAKDEIDVAIPVAMPENILGVTWKPSETTQKVDTPFKPLQPEFGPANPPAKTVGMNKTSFTQTAIGAVQTKEPASLQDAVSAIKITPETPKIPGGPVSIPEKPWEAKSDSVLKPLRTYETDFAEAMARKRISKASFAIAEDEKKIEDRGASKIDVPAQTPAGSIPEPVLTPAPRISTSNTIVTPRPQEVPRKEDYLKNARPPEDEDVQPRNPHTTRNWLLSIISLILICGGAFAGYYLYLKSPIAPAQQPTTQSQPSSQIANSLVLADSKVLISADNRNRNSLISIIKSEIPKPQDPGTIKDIIITKPFAGGVDKVPANEMINLMEIPAPDLIERSLSPSWMLGVYAGTNGIKNPFVISTNNFFQNTFAGIIQWEKTMPDDLKEFLINTSQTENGQDSTNVTLRGQFKDKIVKNKDVREYVAENGYIIFLYSFISNDKLVITNSEQALEEIITRLEKSAFVR